LTADCRIEMAYIDPETYTSIVNHDLRKRILTKLYRSTRDAPISKQELANSLGIEYHQLVYQLNHHLRDFWSVKEEQKVRGTRMELIEAAHPYAVFITIGKEHGIFLVDPLIRRSPPLRRRTFLPPTTGALSTVPWTWRCWRRSRGSRPARDA
jgi:hypothetical protein